MPSPNYYTPGDYTKVVPQEEGNINLYRRKPAKTPEGDTATVRSISIGEDGSEVLIPTVSPTGQLLDDNAAIAEYHKTGKHLGKFASIEEANQYADDLHKQQQDVYTTNRGSVYQNKSGKDFAQDPQKLSLQEKITSSVKSRVPPENVTLETLPAALDFAKNKPKGDFSLSASDLIQGYYGGPEALKREATKARDYRNYQIGYTGEDPNQNLTIQYDRMDEQIPITSTDQVSPGYYPKDRNINVNPPEEVSRFAQEVLDALGEGGGKAKVAEKFLRENNYSVEDIKRQKAEPLADVFSTIEHEAGHHITRGKNPSSNWEDARGKTQTNIGWSSAHEAAPNELANYLGRVQRETYAQTGKRMESPEELDAYMESQKGLPAEKQFEGYSGDTKRGLREIMRSYIDYSSDEPVSRQKGTGNALYKEARKAIPTFVKNDYQPGSIASQYRTS